MNMLIVSNTMNNILWNYFVYHFTVLILNMKTFYMLNTRFSFIQNELTSFMVMTMTNYHLAITTLVPMQLITLCGAYLCSVPIALCVQQSIKLLL